MNRCHFLRAAGVSISLPALESLAATVPVTAELATLLLSGCILAGTKMHFIRKKLESSVYLVNVIGNQLILSSMPVLKTIFNTAMLVGSFSILCQ